jgi:UDP-glucose:tetrahydrobiopterin glucosyltransferase
VRILEVAPLVAPIDDRSEQIGGAQVLLADLAGGLAARGHRVTMAAARGSHVRGVELIDLGIDSSSLVPANLGGSAGARLDNAAQQRAFAAIRAWLDAHSEQIDVVHAHAYDAPAFELLADGPWPVVHTLHLPPEDPVVVAAARRASGARFVTVSRANATSWEAAGVRVDTVIYNGIDLAAVPFGPAGGRYLLYAGRISPEKGVVTALDTASRLGRDLLLVGGLYDRRYYEEDVRPLVRFAPTWQVGDAVQGAVFIGPRPRPAVFRIMGSAATLLMPVRWDEPFGLVALEALAAGTPVVAYARGGLPEIIDEHCGVLASANDADAFVRAVPRAWGLARTACRTRAESFPLATMLDRYERELAGSCGRSA